MSFVAEAVLFGCELDVSSKKFQIFKEIADSGIRVIIIGLSIGDLVLHYLNHFNITILKILSKFDPHHVAHVINVTPFTCIGTLTQASYVDIFKMTEISGDCVTVLWQLTPNEDGHQSHVVGVGNT
ncbi:uncharacterized protein BJ212DRAFT_1302359 [Suillus subaureus]|uniref:Uncharacterized protein n=1 Tax=Suillus subaureus TaxID=48587 RepID=A0A9P7E4P6_9AGAM|nr:uncharacterized protein BJ212DRAFT_1302359 [Suillus subaureus]KAG1810627.1 hypothetical protein BJ212DRAFT_1302359 [Suillus subaureus]